MNIGIVTDSTCDLSASTLQRYGIAAVPLKILVGDEVYRDWRDLEPVTLYDWMRVQGVIPETCPPEVEDFIPVYQRYLGTYDHIVSIHLSSRLSETLDRAKEAASELGAMGRIRFLDSECATAGLAEMVLCAAEATADKADLAGVLGAAERVREQIYLLICPDSLRWLVRGGRIGHVGGMVGDLLGLRPVLTMQEGEIAADGRVRRGAVVNAFIERLVGRFGESPIHLTLAMAGEERETIEQIKRKLESSELNISRGRVQLIGPVIGAHLGPGTLAICAYPEIGAVLDI